MSAMSNLGCKFRVFLVLNLVVWSAAPSIAASTGHPCDTVESCIALFVEHDVTPYDGHIGADEKAVAEALREIGPPAIPPLLELLQHPVERVPYAADVC